MSTFNNTEKLSFKEKAGYSLGDLASHFVWDMVGFWLLFFYTDIFGISPFYAGLIAGAGSIWDAVVDPIVGIVSDRTKTRWGKFRPYLLFGSVPLAIILVLAFTTPAFSPAGMIVYAAITCLLLRTAYAFVNLPYSSISMVMTPDANERTGLNTYRFVSGFSGQLIVTGTFFSLIAYFGMWGNSEKIENLSHEIINVSHEKNIAQGDSIIIFSEEMIENISNGKKILEPAEKIVTIFQNPNLNLAQEIVNISDRIKKSQKKSIAKLATEKKEKKENISRVKKIEALTKEMIENISRVKEIETQAQGIIKFAQEFNSAQGDSIINLAEKIIENTSIEGDVEVAKKAQEIRNTIRAQGVQYAVILFAILGVILFYITFRTTKERIQPLKEQDTSIKKDFKYLLKNRPWIILTIVAIVSMTMFAVQNATVGFYFKYYIGNANGVELFNVIGIIALIIALPFSKPLATRFGDKNLFIASSIISGIFFALIYVAGKDLIFIYAFNILAKMTYAPAVPLLWKMIADAVDFGEWKFGRRTTGLCSSTVIFGQKIGWAIGAFAIGLVLEASKFVANVELQTDNALLGIKLLASVVPGILYASCAIVMIFYTIDTKLINQMKHDLEAKRAAEN